MTPLVRLGAFDVVVVGAGLAGTVGALRAQELGCRTLLIDKAAEPGAQSNTVLSGGNLHVAYTHLLSPSPRLRQRIQETTSGGTVDNVVVDSFIRSRIRAHRWLVDLGIGFESDPTAEWRLWFSPYRPLVGLPSWRGRGPDVALRHLRQRLENRGGTVIGGATGIEFIPDRHRRIAGIAIRHRRTVVDVPARSVLLADGGFQANPRLITTHIGRFADRMKLRATPTGTGDALLMAEPFRASVIGPQHFYGHLLHRDALYDDRLWPYPDIDPLLATGILINQSGSRYADEGLGGVAMANATSRLSDPRGSWVVADSAGWRALRPAKADGGPFDDRIGYFTSVGARVFTGSTLEALAEQIGIDGRSLLDTVAGLNGAFDEERLSRLAVPRTLLPARLECPPFHALPVVPGITFTMGGLLTGRSAQVLDRDRVPVPGLFAAGATMGGLQGGPSGGYVGGLAPALVFGFLAGEGVAQSVRIGRGGRP